MTGAAKRKGDRAEREAARLITTLLGPARRLLGAGRKDDTGDLDGIDGWAVQVADWDNLASALRQKPVDAEIQAANSGTAYGCAMLRLRGGEFRVVMTPQTWARFITDHQGEGTPCLTTVPPLPETDHPPRKT